ncbi:type II toxin-antitoxin system HipA family toxin [Oceanicoccus sp. KOV_DT_Chl]|uniref:type II toxin-antitoxin system HipA family toxin n=1 Tax=Oceanicoccus sp. KOV_DT_Chl TaxID=1904639 RepID=UPI000C7C7D30|nr:type II toxin-antitoxin system HipA family toxin [Oceanicoccus sp. KOV_DT_Chl]
MVTASHDIAEVIVWGVTVGALSFDRASGLGSFEYDSKWLQQGIELFPIHMPLSTEIYSFNNLPRATFKGLPPGLADTLPDDFGNAVINAWLASRGRDTASFSPVERLLYTGNRGMGALEYAPAMPVQAMASTEIELNNMVKFAQKIVSEREQFTLDINSERDSNLEALFQIGTSAGGARAKAVISINKERTSVLSGQIEAPPGYEHYLIKFDGVSDKNKGQETFDDPQGYGRMEYAYYQMAKAAGINIMPSELLERDGLAHFMTKRFDRQGKLKLHYQSLCAMAHVDYKAGGQYSYEELLQLMRQLKLPRPDAIELYRRMVFNVIARNQDDHSKNFGFIINPDGEWRLAPAFDIAYSYRKDSIWVADHQLTINGKRNDFVREDLLAVSNNIARIGKDANGIIDEVIDVVSRWDDYAGKAGAFPLLQQEISKNLRLDI